MTSPAAAGSRHVTKAEALLHNKAKPKPANALGGAAGKLREVPAKVARSRQRGKVSAPCATEIDDLATRLQAAIAGLRR